MLLKGEALIESYTLGFAVHGKRNEWTVTITLPGGIVDERETDEASPYILLNEMLTDGYQAACRQRQRAVRSGVER